MKVLTQRGANLALWNIAGSTVSWAGGRVLVDGAPLVFFHFHGLRRPRKWIFSMSAPYYRFHPTRLIAQHIFTPFVQNLLNIELRHGLIAKEGCRLVPDDGGRSTLKFSQRVRFVAHILLNLLQRNYLIARKGRIISAP